MAFISLDNVVEYQYLKTRKPSKLPLIPCGASSFQSTTEPFLNRSTSVDVCTTVVSPPPASEKPSSSANISAVAKQAQISIEESCPLPAAIIVDSDRSDEKEKNKYQNICEQKIEQDACRSPNGRIRDDHYIEKNKDFSEPLDATVASSATDATVIEPLEIEMSPLVSDSGCEQHRSTVSDTSIEEMPPTALDASFGSAAQSETAGIDQMSMSPINTPTVDARCLDTLADKDKGRQPSVCQHSPIAEAAVAQFAPTQTRQLNDSQLGRNSAAEMPCKSLSVVVPHQPLQSRKFTRTARQSRRSHFSPSAESDDPGDSDYREDSHLESRIEYDEPAARPVKRKMGMNTSMNTSQLHRKRVRAQTYSKSSPPRLAGPESTVQSSTSPETIRIRGQFLRKVSLSRIEYCCWVTEDTNSAASGPVSSNTWASLKKLADEGGQSTSMSDFQAIDIEGLLTRDLKPCGYIWSFNFKEKHAESPEYHSPPKERRVSPTLDDLTIDCQTSPRADESASPKGKDYTAEEDALIVHLKETEKLSWSRIAARFPKRTQMALQVRYCTKLKGRPHQTRSEGLIGPRTGQGQTTTVASSRNTEGSRRQYSLRKLRHSPDRFIAG
ncbi:uncharacterized protein BHQ10_005059 [Talaromyces amestolkiae]|uniref:Myb-like domain-containing protein n=1 Tax=Talaromyces amestolkiae TaxID=1196081 RepID=A0A364KZQ5_TALAM|nr:uncharacterized protein BHQ10_005059 [Talaromyces amestolkiae]RAO69047.1 hypothetical protein BHQ10_005059 [Talaromyces amestolkiae]